MSGPADPTVAGEGEAVAGEGEPAVTVSIVIVTYNSVEYIERCLDSIRACTERYSREILVLDNASADDTVARARRVGGCRVLVSPTNLGFARGCNAAVQLARGRFVLLVNPDAVLFPDAIDAVVEFAGANPDAGPIGGRTVRPDGSVDPRSCWGRQTLWSTLCFATGLSTAFHNSRLFDPESLGSWPRDSVRDVGTVTGYFLLLRRDRWLRLGGMEPTFFMYGDDVDFSERARRLGFRPMITPAALSEHVAGASSVDGDRSVMLLRGRLTLMTRQWSRPRAAAGHVLLRCGVLIRAAAGQRAWRTAWQRRAEWALPYPTVTASAQSDAAALHEPA